MALSCPVCKNPLIIDGLSLQGDTEANCPACRTKFKLQTRVVSQAPSDLSATPKAGAWDLKRALIAVEGEVTDEIISEILSDAGFSINSASSGKEALEFILTNRPGLCILDVGLSDAFGTVMSESGKRSDLKDLKIILVSSIHNKTKYKREPESLYGADGYLERHHIQDRLLEKIQKVMGEPSPPANQPTAASVQTIPTQAPPSVPTPIKETPLKTGRAEAISSLKPDQTIIDEVIRPTHPPEPKPQLIKGDLLAHDAAKRLSRIIISDIALYNQKRIDEGIEKGTFHELLKEELEEGMKLYQSRVPKEVLETTRYFEDGIENFIKKRKQGR